MQAARHAVTPPSYFRSTERVDTRSPAMHAPASLLYAACCCLLALLSPDAAEEQVQGIPQVYALNGSNLTIPGVESELKGDGFLEWSKKTASTKSQSILDYHYGRKGADLQEIYKERVKFFVKNASFHLLGATKRDSGLYVLKLFISGEEKRIQVTVLDAAQKQVLDQQVYVATGSDILISGVEKPLEASGYLEWSVMRMGISQTILSYHHGSNDAEIYYPYDGRVIFDFESASITLPNATHQDTGNYVLQIHLTTASSVDITVVDPLAKVPVVQMLYNEDCSLTLECNTSGDVWNISWWSSGRQVTQNITRAPAGNWSKLLIPADSNGIYTCVASNPISTLAKEYSLVQESSVILYVLGFLIGSLVFSLPLPVAWISFSKCQKYRSQLLAPSEHEKIGVVCWALFLVGSSISYILGQVFSVSYGITAIHVIILVVLLSCIFMELVSWCQKKVEQLINGPLKYLRIILHFIASGGTCFTAVYYFSVHLPLCARPPHFTLALCLAAVLPVAIVLLIYCCWCRPDGRIKHYLKGFRSEITVKTSPADQELCVVTDGNAGYRHVPEDDCSKTDHCGQDTIALMLDGGVADAVTTSL
ncbi:uncharacterized protein [Ambystoma mexicanum]|uniref:uncharacterized protein isoform X2 n=1 Tax=Ambystoma mexicanum TaxID=8296 RepID=UPI0037E93515